MVVLWGLNGYVQSMGWGPTVKTMASWFPRRRRNLLAGRLATSYILGGRSTLVAGTIIARWSWRQEAGGRPAEVLGGTACGVT